MMVKDTDKGRELMIQINDLKNYWWLTKTELSRKRYLIRQKTDINSTEEFCPYMESILLWSAYRGFLF